MDSDSADLYQYFTGYFNRLITNGYTYYNQTGQKAKTEEEEAADKKKIWNKVRRVFDDSNVSLANLHSMLMDVFRSSVLSYNPKAIHEETGEQFNLLTVVKSNAVKSLRELHNKLKEEVIKGSTARSMNKEAIIPDGGGYISFPSGKIDLGSLTIKGRGGNLYRASGTQFEVLPSPKENKVPTGYISLRRSGDPIRNRADLDLKIILDDGQELKKVVENRDAKKHEFKEGLAATDYIFVKKSKSLLLSTSLIGETVTIAGLDVPDVTSLPRDEFILDASKGRIYFSSENSGDEISISYIDYVNVTRQQDLEGKANVGGEGEESDMVNIIDQIGADVSNIEDEEEAAQARENAKVLLGVIAGLLKDPNSGLDSEEISYLSSALGVSTTQSPETVALSDLEIRKKLNIGDDIRPYKKMKRRAYKKLLSLLMQKAVELNDEEWSDSLLKTILPLSRVMAKNMGGSDSMPDDPILWSLNSNKENEGEKNLATEALLNETLRDAKIPPEQENILRWVWTIPGPFRTSDLPYKRGKKAPAQLDDASIAQLASLSLYDRLGQMATKEYGKKYSLFDEDNEDSVALRWIKNTYADALDTFSKAFRKKLREVRKQPTLRDRYGHILKDWRQRDQIAQLGRDARRSVMDEEHGVNHKFIEPVKVKDREEEFRKITLFNRLEKSIAPTTQEDAESAQARKEIEEKLKSLPEFGKKAKEREKLEAKIEKLNSNFLLKKEEDASRFYKIMEEVQQRGAKGDRQPLRKLLSEATRKERKAEEKASAAYDKQNKKTVDRIKSLREDLRTDGAEIKENIRNLDDKIQELEGYTGAQRENTRKLVDYISNDRDSIATKEEDRAALQSAIERSTESRVALNKFLRLDSLDSFRSYLESLAENKKYENSEKESDRKKRMQYERSLKSANSLLEKLLGEKREDIVSEIAADYEDVYDEEGNLEVEGFTHFSEEELKEAAQELSESVQELKNEREGAKTERDEATEKVTETLKSILAGFKGQSRIPKDIKTLAASYVEGEKSTEERLEELMALRGEYKSESESLEAMQRKYQEDKDRYDRDKNAVLADLPQHWRVNILEKLHNYVEENYDGQETALANMFSVPRADKGQLPQVPSHEDFLRKEEKEQETPEFLQMNEERRKELQKRQEEATAESEKRQKEYIESLEEAQKEFDRRLDEAEKAREKGEEPPKYDDLSQQSSYIRDYVVPLEDVTSEESYLVPEESKGETTLYRDLLSFIQNSVPSPISSEEIKVLPALLSELGSHMYTKGDGYTGHSLDDFVPSPDKEKSISNLSDVLHAIKSYLDTRPDLKHKDGVYNLSSLYVPYTVEEEEYENKESRKRRGTERETTLYDDLLSYIQNSLSSPFSTEERESAMPALISQLNSHMYTKEGGKGRYTGHSIHDFVPSTEAASIFNVSGVLRAIKSYFDTKRPDLKVTEGIYDLGPLHVPYPVEEEEEDENMARKLLREQLKDVKGMRGSDPSVLAPWIYPPV